MTAFTEPAEQTPAPGSGLSETKIAGRLAAFVADHGGSGTAVINYLGRGGARIVVVSAAGPFADAVVSSVEAAEGICRTAGIEVGEWDRELGSKVSVSSADRQRMAGTGR